MARKTKKKGRGGQVVARTGELTHGTTKKVLLRCGGNTIEAVLLNFKGDIYAYVNRCRHIPISMDWVDNQFFTEDKRYLICANHGAIYEPATGECLWGPCFGAFLQGIPLKISGEKILVSCPEEEEKKSGGA